MVAAELLTSGEQMEMGHDWVRNDRLEKHGFYVKRMASAEVLSAA